jgi:hypothetical protein
MIDLAFKVASVILFIFGIIFRFSSVGDPIDGSVLMVSAVFIFLLAQIISELRIIKESLGKKQ